MKAKTYTLLLTLTGREPADLEALAQRIQADLETGTAAGAPYASAQVDAFEGDLIKGNILNRPLHAAQNLHHELRKQ